MKGLEELEQLDVLEGLEALDVPELERRTEQCCEMHRSALSARQWSKAAALSAKLSTLAAALDSGPAEGNCFEALVAWPGKGKGKGKGAPGTVEGFIPY